MFTQMGFHLEKEEISTWLDSDRNDCGVQIFTDDDICDLVLNDSKVNVSDSENMCSDEEVEDFILEYSLIV